MTVSFKCDDGQHYLCAEPDGRVVADRTAVGEWEQWQLEPHGSAWALKSAHGRYLCAEPDGSVVANREAVGPWETWLVETSAGRVAFKSAHGLYLVAEMGGGGVVRANRPQAGPWEQFTPSAEWWQPAPPDGTGGRQGLLKVGPFGYFDDRGLLNPVYAHAGNLFSLFTREPMRALKELDDVAAAGYQGVRVWATLGGSYWTGDHVGPDVTPGYFVKVRGFADALRLRGLRAVWSQGDVGQIRDRKAYMMQLAAVDVDCGGFIDFIDGGNEAWQTGEPDPVKLAQFVGYYQAAGGQAIRSLTSPPGETAPQLDAYSIDPAQVFDVHSERDGHSWDKRRHIFSISYEGKPRRRYGINSEPPGNGALVSASANKGELDDEAVGLLAVAAIMSRQAFVWFSGEGVKIREGLHGEAGFSNVPKLVAVLPNDLMNWPTLHHSGDRWVAERFVEAQGEVRIDCSARGAERVGTIDGPSGTYDLKVTKSFRGTVWHPGTGASEPVEKRAGERWRVSFTRGRVFHVTLT